MAAWAILSLLLLSGLPPAPPPNQLSAPPIRPTIESLIDAGRLEEARLRLREKIGDHAPGARDLFLEAMILYKEQRHEDSLRTLNRSVQLDRKDPDVYKLIGLNLVALDRFALAGPFLEEATALAPKDFMAWYYLGLHRVTVAHYQQAEPALRRAIELEPGYLDSHTTLGLALENLNRPEEAIQAYRRAISLAEQRKLRPDGPYLYLGRLLFTLDRHQQAVEPLRAAVERNPAPVEALRYLGRSLLQLERPAEAAPALERAVHLAPNDAPLRYLLARAYRALGRTADAEAQLRAIEAQRERK